MQIAMDFSLMPSSWGISLLARQMRKQPGVTEVATFIMLTDGTAVAPWVLVVNVVGN